MTIDEITAVLSRAMTLRMPRFTADDSPGRRIEKLEDYLGETAIARAELEEARFYAYEAGRALKDEWEAITGWESLVDAPRRDRTQADIDNAKRQISPGVQESMGDAKHLVDRLTDQIKRLQLDDAAASRRYTMMVGG